MGFESGSFDTVVDTFGLCSYEDPVAALRDGEGVQAGGSACGKWRLLRLHGRRADAG